VLCPGGEGVYWPERKADMQFHLLPKLGTCGALLPIHVLLDGGFTTASRTALEPTQPPIQWIPGALSLGLKRPRREADHSPPSSAKVNK
jgi:hypothetical protein